MLYSKDQDQDQDYKNWIEFLEEEERELVRTKKPLYDLLDKIPFQYQKFVSNTINTIHKGNVEEYKKTIPVFLEKFSSKFKLYAENDFSKDNRELNKKKKQAILWAGQLLKTVGGKHMTQTAPFAVINEYQNQIEKQTEFCQKNKLMNSAGKFFSLTTPEQRKKQRNAENIKRIKAMEKKAKDLGFIFIFLTFTLPPVFHPNPSIGKNSYNGASPEQALDTINHFWKIYRANLAEQGLKTGSDFFGVWVKEGHKDSCIHKHALLFIDPQKVGIYKRIFNTVLKNERIRLARFYNFEVKKFKMNWDFKEEANSKNKKKAKASSYLFKYLSPDINHKDTLANDALFFAYGSRRIQFFGEKGKMTVFRHLVKNWKEYKNSIKSEAVIDMLETKNLYLFNKYHQENFKNVSVVTFDKKRNYLGVSYIPKDTWDGIHQQELLISKKQFSLIEDKEEILHSNNLGNKAIREIVLKHIDKAQERQRYFNNLMVSYFKKQLSKGIDNFLPQLNTFYSETTELTLINHLEKTLKIQRENIENTTKHNLLTVNHNYSSKNASHFWNTGEMPFTQTIPEAFFD